MKTDEDDDEVQQGQSSGGLDQEDPAGPPHIKEEAEDADISGTSHRVKDSFRRRLLTATRRDLEELFRTMTSEFEKEIECQQKLLDLVLKPEVKLRRAVQQGRSSGLDQDSFRRRLLTATRRDLEELFRTMTSEFEREIERQQKLLDLVLKPEVKLRRADVRQLLVTREERQDWSSSLDQEDPPEPPHIKEEQEELSIHQEEAGIITLTVPVKSEDDDEEKPPQLQQRHTEEDCGGPEPTRDPETDERTEDSSDSESDRHRKSSRCRKKPFSCSVRGKEFVEGSAHGGVKPHSCSDTSGLREGVRQATQSPRNHSDKRRKSLSCSECDATFPNNYLLMTHIRMHKGKKLFTCSICGAKRHFSSHLEVHMRTHTGEKPYSCPVCAKRFSQRGIVKQHMAIHSGVKPFGCSDCGRRFFWQFQVKKHKCFGTFRNCFSGRNSEPIRIFNPFRSLKRLAEKEAKVPESDMDFWRETRKHQWGLTYRRKVNDGHHAGKKAERSDGPSDQNHVRNKEDPGFNIDMKPSVSSVHHSRSEDTPQTGDTGEKPFSCLFCERTFGTGGHLTGHISVHIGEKLLSCIVCEKTFSCKSQLINHECVEESSRSQSEDPNKPLHCSVCNAGFIDRESLLQHMRIHTRQTQFSCSVCGKEFAWRRLLTKHMQSHTGQNIFKCRVCARGFQQIYQLNYHQCFRKSSHGGGPEPARSTHPGCRLQPEDSSEPDTDSQEPRNSEDASLSFTTNKKTDGCSETSSDCHLLESHRRSLSQHMWVHTGTGAKEEEPEPPHMKEEPKEVRISQEEFTGVPVKTDEDSEQNCGGPEPAGTSDPDRQPDSDDSVDSDFWKETRERPTDLNQEILGCDSGLKGIDCSEAPESVERDSGDSHVWTETRQESRRKPFSCSECGRRFLHIHHLKNHMRFHGRQRAPFSCSVCGHEFLYKSLLKIHMRTHTGEKPFSCPACHKKYAHKASMQAHMVIHTVDQRYRCDACHQTFGWLTELKYHQCAGRS